MRPPRNDRGTQVQIALQTLAFPTIALTKSKVLLHSARPPPKWCAQPLGPAGLGASRMARPNSSPNPSFEARSEVVVPRFATLFLSGGKILRLVCLTLQKAVLALAPALPLRGQESDCTPTFDFLIALTYGGLK